jgi:hypothetical protein
MSRFLEFEMGRIAENQMPQADFLQACHLSDYPSVLP